MDTSTVGGIQMFRPKPKEGRTSIKRPEVRKPSDF